MEEGFTLGRQAIRQLQALVRSETLRAIHSLHKPRQLRVEAGAVYLAETPAGGIAAMSGSTPGSATCTIKYIDADGVMQTATDSSGDTITQTVYNVASNAVDGSTVIQAKQEVIGGALLCDFEDC